MEKDNRRFKMLSSKTRILSGCGSAASDVVQNTVSNPKNGLDSSKSAFVKPSKVAKQEKRISRRSEMQQQMNHFQEDLKRTKDQLSLAEDERERALDELREAKRMAGESASKKTREMQAEISALKKSLSESDHDSKAKEKRIESLKFELEKAIELRSRLVEKDAVLDKLKEELSNAKSSETHKLGLLSESKKRVGELEFELAKERESETKMLNSFAAQTKQLEQTKIALEESRHEVASLHEKVRSLEVSSENSHGSVKETLESLKSELQMTKDNLVRAHESEKFASSKVESLLKEMGSLRNELKLAVEAEEKGNKAMDDLALALKEVATETNQVKEKLTLAEVELEHTKEEVEQWKKAAKSNGDKCEGLLNEAKVENDRLKNTIERLRTEAEEMLLAWHEKETGFVDCIRRAEEEKAAAQQESSRLMESISETQSKTQASREENHKLRDILKQALNESNAAKEAAGIATAENSELKDCLAEKDNALDILTRENESLRIEVAAARETSKELKRLLSVASGDHKEMGGILGAQSFVLKEEKSGSGSRLSKALSFDLMEPRVPTEHKVVEEDDPVKAEALRGSIFDSAESPEKAAPHHRRGSSVFADDGLTTISSEDYDHIDGNNIDDAENGRSLLRKKRALLQKFGKLIRRGSFHNKREPSME